MGGRAVSFLVFPSSSFLRRKKWSYFYLMGWRAKLVCGKLKETLCAASTPPQRRGHTRDLKIKGVSRPRTKFGGCREKRRPAVEFWTGLLATPGRSFQVHWWFRGEGDVCHIPILAWPGHYGFLKVSIQTIQEFRPRLFP